MLYSFRPAIRRVSLNSLMLPLVLLAALIMSGQVIAESVIEEYDFGRWETLFSQTEDYLENNSFDDERATELNSALNDVRSEALGLRDSVSREIEAARKLLEALGERPADNEAPESEVIAEKRQEYESQITDLKEQLAQIELAVVRTNDLADGLSQKRTGLFLEEIFSRYPIPLKTETVYSALREALGHLSTLVSAPVEWFRSLDTEGRNRLALIPTLLVLVFSLALGFLLRRLILRRYGRDEQNTNPSPTLRISAAIAEGVARGVVPLLTLSGLALWVIQHNWEIEGLLRDMMLSGFRASIYFIGFSALTMAVLSPDKPDWRLVQMSQLAARILGYTTMALIGVVSLDFFVVESTRTLTLSLQMQSVYISLAIVLKAGLILVLCIERWWQPGEGEEADVAPSSNSDSNPLLSYLRRVVAIIAAISIIATLSGYANFAGYLIDSLINSALYLLGFLGLRAILVELLAAVTRSSFLRKQLGLRIITLQRIRLWVGGLITTSVSVLAIMQLLLVWGVAKSDLSRWIQTMFTGFSVGSITISVTEIVFAIGVFVAVMVMTRLFQRALLGSILPQFTSDRSVQHSLSSGAGYIGFLLALMMFIAALGIKLESLIIVAGALSVGIGFGLQNIVNNFVSGLILILERPIKVGDWVVIGQNEGFVQEINFRATELQTFTRASVIIPNSEMLSNAVTNLTYHDKIARVEIPLQVAYGSDPDRVIEILEQAAESHDDVLVYPKAFVLLLDFAADGLNFELRCYVRDGTEKLSVSSTIRLDILRRLNEEGIEIPFPQRVIHLENSRSDNEGDSADNGNLQIT